MQELLSKGIFNFCIHDNNITSNKIKKFVFGKYMIYLDHSTPIINYVSDNRQIIVFGYAVNVQSGEHQDIAKRIIDSTNNLFEVIEYERYLGGKYIIFYRQNDLCYAIPDATASIPFCYSVGTENTVCSSVSEYVAKHMNIKTDPLLQKIRDYSDISQAMPHDVTVYKEIKQLLPNHYYSFDQGRAYRFINEGKSQEKISPEIAAQITVPYIQKIAEYYASCFRLYCPITSGRDSRVVLAFLLKIINETDLECYTIKHKEHSGFEQDMVIPKQIAEKMGFRYKQITDILPAETLLNQTDLVLGKNKYSKRTLMIVNTVFNNFDDGAIINGDIIGQVGKCSLHRDIPLCLASAKYFRCKLHNYSKESVAKLQDWIDEIRGSKESVNIFDLFSIENRMGRWAAQENTVYNVIGQKYLNIFNSRSIIYEWTRVSRGLRKKFAVHMALLDAVDKRLANIPFEKDNNFLTSLSKSNGIFYYLFGFIKFFAQKMIFFINKK